MEGTIKTYRTIDTHGKSQLDLIIQVYDGALGSYRKAKEHYVNNDLQAGYEQLERAKRFLVHLYTTLDNEKGGQIADNLGQLYSFAISETDVVIATKELSKIDDIISIIDNLRSGWAELRTQQAEVDMKKHSIEAGNPKESFSTSA